MIAMAPTNTGGFMTTEAVSDYLAISRKRVNELIRNKELPVVVRGPRTRLIPRSAVEALAHRWLAEAGAAAH